MCGGGRVCECSTEHILFNKTDFVIGNCLNDGLFSLVISSMILPHDKIGLNEGQERYRGSYWRSPKSYCNLF